MDAGFNKKLETNSLTWEMKLVLLEGMGMWSFEEAKKEE